MSKEVSLKIEKETIVFAVFTDRENLEIIVICESGKVYLFDFSANKNRLVGTLEFPLQYSKDLFKYFETIDFKKDFLLIKTYKDFVCIVQKYGQNGVIFNLENPEYKKELKRGDYCVEFCAFPIAFYSRQDSTFLIHGTDWNRLDITCLENDELLTDRIVDYETDTNYFDYFHSSLLISPDEKYFTSNGWVWHPFGQITLYSIDNFLKNFELSHQDIDLAEDCYGFDWDRPLCWIDEKTLAVGFSRNTEDDGKNKFPDEILFVDMVENKTINRIEFEGFGNTSDGDVFGELFFDKNSSRFICLNKIKGLYISDIDGKELIKEINLASHHFSDKHRLFYKMDYQDKMIRMISLEEIYKSEISS